jgi:hypothetical protein
LLEQTEAEGMANLSKTTQDHEEIQRWAEERGGKPSHVRSTGSGEDIGILRIDFPGYSGEGSLEPITWEQFFEKFDERNLALLYQEETAGGERSNFNKIVSAETAQENERGGHGKGHSRRGSKSAKKAGSGRGGSSSSSKRSSVGSSTSAKKTASKKTGTKAASKQAPAKKAAGKKAVAKKAATKKAPAKKGNAKSSSSKSSASKKTSSKKAGAKSSAKTASKRRR